MKPGTAPQSSCGVVWHLLAVALNFLAKARPSLAQFAQAPSGSPKAEPVDSSSSVLAAQIPLLFSRSIWFLPVGNQLAKFPNFCLKALVHRPNLAVIVTQLVHGAHGSAVSSRVQKLASQRLTRLILLWSTTSTVYDVLQSSVP